MLIDILMQFSYNHNSGLCPVRVSVGNMGEYINEADKNS